MLNGAKNLWNAHESTFIKFVFHSEQNWLGKRLSYWYLNSYESLLKHWLRITSILFVLVAICRYCIKCNSLKNWKIFLNFPVHFWNLHQNLNILLKKKWHSESMYFWNYRLSNIWLDECLDSLVLEHPLTVNLSKRPKHLWNLHKRTFIILLAQC